jgi:hypothetical protein
MNTLNLTMALLDERSLVNAFYVVTSLYITGLNLAQAARYYGGEAGAFSCANWTTQLAMRTGPVAFGLSNYLWLLVVLTAIDIFGRFVVLVAVFASRLRRPATPCRGA